MPVDKLVARCGKYGKAALAHPQYPLMKNIAFFSLANLLGNFFAFLFHFYIARALTVVEYGAISALIAAFGLFSLPIGSFAILVVKKVAQDKAKAASVAKGALNLSLAFAATVCFAIIVFSQAFLGFFHLEEWLLVPLFAFGVLLGCVSAALNGVLQGLENFFLSGSSFVAGSLVKLLLGFVLVGALGYGMLGALGAFVAAIAVSTGIVFCYLFPLLKEKGEPYYFWNMKKDFLVITAISIGMFLALSGDLIVLGNLFPEDELGFYAAGSMLAKIISYALLPLSAVVFPKMVESAHLKKSSNVLFVGLALLAVAGAAFLAFYWFFGGFALSFLYSDKYLAGLSYLMVLSLSVVFYCFNALLSRQFIAERNSFYTIAVLAIPIAGLALLYFIPDISFAPYVMLGLNAVLFVASMVLLKNGRMKAAAEAPVIS